MHTSMVYVKHQDFSYEVVYQKSRIGMKLLLAGFVLINIMAMLLLVLLSLRYYPKLWDMMKQAEGVEQMPRKESYVYSLYWATVFVFFSMNVVFVGVVIIAHMFRWPDLQKCYKGEMSCTDHFVRDVSLTKFIVTFVLAFVFLGGTSLLATKDCKDDKSNIVGIVYWSLFWWYFAVKYLDTNKFFGGKSSTICNKSKCSWVFQSLALWNVQSLALWNVLIFLQMLASASLSTFLLLLLYPEQVLSAVLFIFSGIFCLVFSVAHILLLDRNHKPNPNPNHNPDNPDKQRQFWKSYRVQVLIQAFAVLLLIALIGVIVAFYILLLSHGLRTAGIFGFIIVNLPSLILSGCGYIIKMHLESITSKKKGTSPKSTQTMDQ